MPPIPDLVHLSRLEVEFLASSKEIRQVIGAGGASPGRRRLREEQTWMRERQLGRGGFGTVLLERCTGGSSKGNVRAVKELRKLSNANYHRELEAAALFSHARYEENFVKSFGWYETAECIYMTMEYLSYGDLQQHIGKPVPETECQLIVAQVLEGLDFMHERGFTHRDLKPPNILVSAPGPDWWVKLSDFGISKRAEAGVTNLHTQIFTPGFAAPEIFFMHMMEDVEDDVAYTEAVDIWSAGVVTLLLLTAEAVFDERRTLLRYCKGKQDPVLATLANHTVSDAGRDFVRELLYPIPQDRPTAKECLKRDWLMSVLLQPSVNTSVSMPHSSQSSSIQNPTEFASSFFEPSARWSTSLSDDQQPQSLASTSEPSAARIVSQGSESSPEQRFETASLDSSGNLDVDLLATNLEQSVGLGNADGNDPATQEPEPPAAPRSGFQSQFAQADQTNESSRQATTYSIPREPLRPPPAPPGAFAPLEPSFHATNPFRAISTTETPRSYWHQQLRDSGYASVEALGWRDSATLSGHTETLTALAFSLDGRHLVSASADGMLRIWNPNTLRLLSTRHLNKQSAIEHIAISSDSETMATRSEAGQLLLWDLLDGEAEPTIQLASNSEYGSPPVTFSPDGKFVAWIDPDSAINVRDVATGMLQTTVTHSSVKTSRFKGNISTFAFSPNSKYIISGSEAGSSDPVSVWGLHKGQKLMTLRRSVNQDLGVWQVAFAFDLNMAAALSNRSVEVWSSSGDRLRTIWLNSEVNDLTFAPGCRLLAVALEDENVGIWDMDKADLFLGSMLRPSASVECVRFSSDDKYLATARQASVQLWNTKTRKLRFVDDAADLSSRSCFAFSPDGQVLAWGGAQEVRLLDLRKFSD